MEEVSKCLKPGGLAIFIDVDLEILHRDMVTVLPMALLDHEIRAGVENGAGKELEASWLQRVAYGMSACVQLVRSCSFTFRNQVRGSTRWK